MHGISNSRAIDESEFISFADPDDPGDIIIGLGIDTIGYAWRVASPSFWAPLEVAVAGGQLYDSSVMPFDSVPRYETVVTRGQRGSGQLAERIGGAVWTLYPRNRLITCEGRLAGLLGETEDLIGGSSVPAGARAAENAISPYGINLRGEGCPAMLRRLDLAVDLSFSDGLRGENLLTAFGAWASPKYKTNVWLEAGRVQTASLFTKKTARLVFRAYDKGVKARTAPPFRRIRLERQIRFAKRDQKAVSALGAEELAAAWSKPVTPLCNASRFSAASTAAEAEQRISEAFESGHISDAVMERMLGTVRVLSQQGRAWWELQARPHIARRRVRELRELGVLIEGPGLTSEASRMEAWFRVVRLAWLVS